MNKCKNCKFYFDSKCRRFPPQVGLYSYKYEAYESEHEATATESHFPSVSEDEWCGEFTEKKGEE